MVIPRTKLGLRVALALLVSSLLWLAEAARAHEVQPSVADLTITGETLELAIEATLEPLIAGVDLDGLANTDSSAQAQEVDRLRALPPDALESAFRQAWPGIAEKIAIRSGDERIRPELVAMEVPEVGDVELPRLSRIVLQADLPPGDAPVVLGWAAEFGALVVRQMGMGEDAYTGYLTAGDETAPIARAEATPVGMGQTILDYLVIGFEHIVPKGLDHILFVLGLFFLSLRLGPLLWQVSAFTVAHTITLALGILGIVTVPAAIVEPLIAASIVYVGIENVLTRGLSPWRPVIVFLFGLLHGLGFASVLGEIGLNPAQFVAGLISFNIGVELGQLAVIAAAFLLVGLPFGRQPWYRKAIAIPASLAIAAIGAWWVVERTLLG
jgi:hypothetical protein